MRPEAVVRRCSWEKCLWRRHRGRPFGRPWQRGDQDVAAPCAPHLRWSHRHHLPNLAREVIPEPLERVAVTKKLLVKTVLHTSFLYKILGLRGVNFHVLRPKAG